LRTARLPVLPDDLAKLSSVKPGHVSVRSRSARIPALVIQRIGDQYFGIHRVHDCSTCLWLENRAEKRNRKHRGIKAANC
jgi:hypothetical protein